MRLPLPSDSTVADLLNAALKLDGFFPEFTANHVQKVFLRSGFYLYSAGTPVLEQETQGRDLFVVQDGTLAVLRQEKNLSFRVGELRKGDIFGEIGLLHSGIRVASVIAEADSKVFRIAHADLDYLLKHNKPLGLHLDGLAKKRLSFRPLSGSKK